MLLAQHEYGFGLIGHKRGFHLYRQDRQFVPKQRRLIGLNPFPPKSHQQTIGDFSGPMGRDENLVSIAELIQKAIGPRGRFQKTRTR
jgi:hypothetical protein